jgi:hypothetical protein
MKKPSRTSRSRSVTQKVGELVLDMDILKEE